MSREPDAFEEFFRRHFRHVVGFLVTLGFELDKAREVTSEAMYRAYLNWSTISYPRAWVYTTAERIAVHESRRDADGIVRAIRGGWAAPPLIDPCKVVDGYAEVVTVLSALPPAQRHVMAWFMHGFTPSEIAELTGMKPATARSHLRHARERLRVDYETGTLKPPGPDDPDASSERKEVIDDAQ